MTHAMTHIEASMKNFAFRQLAGIVALLTLGAAASSLLTGCGSGTPASAAPQQISLTGLHGQVYGGRQPIAFATINMYQAGTGGYGAGATTLIAGGTMTNSTGQFSLTGKYSCTSGSYVYITSTGGNPGAGTNASATLMLTLGLCDNAPNIPYIDMDELTTVASVWSLSPFMSGSVVSTSSTNTAGLAAAFADVNTLVDITTGYAHTSTANVTLPSTTIYTLGDILASCINSTGVGDNAGCDTLFANAPNSAGTHPTDTLTAALNIARNPGANVNNLLALALPVSPYGPVLSSAKDFTLGATYSGNGISAPTAAAIDASGNVWIANAGNNSVTELSHIGTALSSCSPQPCTTGYNAGALSTPSAIAIDTSGDVWIANAGNSTITELNASGANVGASPFSGGGLSTPTGIAFDATGNAWLSNSGNSSISAFNSAGTPLSPSGYPTTSTTPLGVAINPR